jgi:hypothetical protein
VSSARSLTWIHTGVLHMDEATGLESRKWHAAIDKRVGDEGRDIYSVGALPEHGILGGQLGLNKNGKRW